MNQSSDCQPKSQAAKAPHVCPWWIGYLLASPIRRLYQKPEVILGPHVEAGMTVLDVGCAMGFFSIPMARLVGEQGRVICVDVQERMLRSLVKRAAKAHVSDRIEPRLCPADGLGLDDLEQQIDFVLAFAVVHEVPDPDRFFVEARAALVPGGRLLLAEPGGHVSAEAFDRTLRAAGAAGLSIVERPEISRSHAALLEKPR